MKLTLNIEPKPQSWKLKQYQSLHYLIQTTTLSHCLTVYQTPVVCGRTTAEYQRYGLRKYIALTLASR